MKKYWTKAFVTFDGWNGSLAAKERIEITAATYLAGKLSAAKRHNTEHKEFNVPSCFYCSKTNNNLTLEEEKNIIEAVNKQVEEKKNEKVVAN